MKMRTNILLATAVLAGSILASAQTTTQGSEDATRQDNMAAPVANGGGAYEPFNTGTARPNDNNTFRDKSNADTNSQDDNKQMAPADPQKNPYWEPRDWNYINNDNVGG